MPSRGIPNNLCRDRHMKAYTQPVIRRRKKKQASNKPAEPDKEKNT